MGGFRVFVFLAGLMALASSASAVTTDQVVALKKAGVSDAVILALMERDHTGVLDRARADCGAAARGPERNA